MSIATEIFAEATDSKLSGPSECHYCGAPCGRDTPHLEPLRFGELRPRPAPLARRPGGQFMCAACRTWHRPRGTVLFLDGGLKDGQRLCDHSVLVTPQAVWGVRKSSARALYAALLNPPCRFALALTDGRPNLFWAAPGNDVAVIRADTPLAFASDNVHFTYTVYELGQAHRDSNGLGPGVAELVRLFGPVPEELVPVEERDSAVPARKAGRPRMNADARVGQQAALVTASGAI